MVSINVSYTAPINPHTLPTTPLTTTSPPPSLTRAQCWQGLQLKVRNAPAFVGAIATCKVLSEDEESGAVTRVVTFKAEPEKEVKEVCRSYEDMKVDFVQTDGSVISNIISDGPTGRDDDLYMTYAFQWLHPEVEAGSEKEAELRAHHKAVAKMAVDKSIEAIRRMVKEGEIV